jgi:membrane-associated protease RseP (regulator of RpoE activity)
VLFLGRWLLGHLALRRLLARPGPVPEGVSRLFAAMTAGRRRPRLLVSRRARVPFSCGLLRPTVVLPLGLAEGAPAPVLRWVLAHELAHLGRRDAWAGLLFGLGQAVYFYLPWFWWLRRQVRLCQEYIADAAAVAAAGCPEDYAQFLVCWAAAPAPPAGVTGVCGRSSDLFRRISMLLQNRTPVEPRCPRRWSLGVACGLLSLAVVGAGVGLRAQAAPAPTKKEEPKKEEPKKEAPARPAPKADGSARPAVPGLPKDFDELFKGRLRGLDPGQMKDIEKQMEQARRDMEQALRALRERGRLPGAWADFGLPGRRGPQRQPRLGAHVAQPSATLVDQLDLPKGQGLVVEDVTAHSAAEKAGLKAHDILLEVAGKPVSSNVDEFLKVLDGVKAQTPVAVVVLRKGKKETLKGLSLPEARAARGGDDLGFFPPAGNLRVPGLAGAAAPGGKNVTTTTFRNNGRFTTRHQEGDLVITVTGKVSGGKGQVSEVVVRDGDKSTTYAGVDKVPERYRDKVKNLVEMTEKGNARIESKKP